MMPSGDLELYLGLWVLVTAVVIHLRLRQAATGSGLVVAYLLNLWAIHWLGAALYALPWWRTEAASGLVEAGFRQATYGLLAAAVGSVVVAPALRRVMRPPETAVETTTPEPKLAVLYMIVGTVSYLVLMPLLRTVPSATALISAAWRLLVVGLALLLWKTWHDRRWTAFKFALVMALGGLPLMTIAHAGFLSYGSSAALTLLVFVATFVRPRWKVVVAAALIGYAGLSFFVTYMRGRQEIRAIVWEAATLGDRVNPILDMLTHWEWLDLSNEDHLIRIDERLNQNYLVGAAVQYLDVGLAEFARGGTLWEAVVALIPRAFWPEKPTAAGSGDLVSEYTGIAFGEDTSVGIGQIMEFYVNFGAIGVVLGCLVLGTALSLLDSAAGRCLRAGDWPGFACWFLPGLSFLNVEGSLVETTSSAAAAVVTAYLVNRYFLHRFRGRGLPPAPA